MAPFLWGKIAAPENEADSPRFACSQKLGYGISTVQNSGLR